MSTSPFSLGTTLADAVANNNAYAPVWRDAFNRRAQEQYDGAVRNYNTNMETGQLHNPPLVPPEAPFAYELTTPDANGFIFPALSTTIRLTPTPPLTVDTVDLGGLKAPTAQANHISINWKARQGKWVTANLEDGMPGGFKSPPLVDEAQPNNPPHTYERFTAAVGPGWWLQLD